MIIRYFIWLVWMVLGVILVLGQISFLPVKLNASETISSNTLVQSEQAHSRITVFGRDDCGFCKQLFNFLESENIPYNYLNITDDKRAHGLFLELTAKHDLMRVTPITVVDDRVFVGFNSARTTGDQIISHLRKREASGDQMMAIEEHLLFAPIQISGSAGGCTDISCDVVDEDNSFVFDLPIVGLIDLKSLSLFSLSLVLGIVDGFNPCAMWVLITFLALLAQAGSRQKMIFLAGLFILAQGLMYNLILNVWYKTWDFVALDEIVTPLVGFIALGGGLFFVWRWYKNRQVQLVCDITSIDTQMKTVDRFKKIVNQPITFASIIAIFVIAFSVNIIEFACSIGIPQAYTKILELNMLSFWERQWYILVFTLAYMFDDVLVFGLAIWGYGKLHAHGQRYAHLSLIIGGLLMIGLGIILILFPNLLVL